ncbi:MAG: GWxTD domain-containing protein [Parcubacteria group bacterium]|nr:GWxTD domain-containing protein [Parcubacteria group bacterium]
MKSISIFLISIFLCALARAQIEENSGPIIEAFPFKVVSAQFFDPEKNSARLNIYVGISFSSLSFILTGDQIKKYRAEYDIEYYLFTKKNECVASFENMRIVEVASYDQTQQQNIFYFETARLYALAGEYTLRIRISDHARSETQEYRRIVSIKKFLVNEFAISDPLLVWSVTWKDGSADKITPHFEKISGSDSTILIYFEVYNGAKGDIPLSFLIQLFDRHSEKIFEENYFATCLGIVSGERRQISLRGIPYGEYVLKILAEQGTAQAAAEIPLPFYWRSFSSGGAIKDLNEAIDQLRYIVPEGQLKKIKRGTPDEQEKKFFDYWKSRDPSPTTVENELMTEYYRRVSYANDHYTVFKKLGWKSDRGMIYIILGPPDEVQRYPFEIDMKPREVWHYYMNIKRKKFFIFEDQYGYGDYELIYPQNFDYFSGSK